MNATLGEMRSHLKSVVVMGLAAASVILAACGGPSQDDREAALDETRAWLSSEPALKNLKAELPPPKFSQDSIDLFGELNVASEEEFLQAMDMVLDKDLSGYEMILKTHVHAVLDQTTLGWQGSQPPEMQHVRDMLKFVDPAAQQAWVGFGGRFVRNPSASEESAQEYVWRAAELVDKQVPGNVKFEGFDPEVSISEMGAVEGLSLIDECFAPLTVIHATSVSVRKDEFESIQLFGPLDEEELLDLQTCMTGHVRSNGTHLKLTTPDGELAEALMGGEWQDEVKSDTERRFRELMEGAV